MEYAELSDRAKAYALATYGQPPDDWYECVYENAKQEGKERGFLIEDIQFSGFHSQGDGASWTGEVNFAKFIEYHIQPNDPDYARYVVLLELIKEGWLDKFTEIYRYGYMYSHSNTMRSGGVNITPLDDLDHDNLDTLATGIMQGANVYELSRAIDYEYLVNDLDTRVLEKAREYADDIYKRLEADYESYMTDEVFEELIYINGWRFDDAGKLITQE